jgi:uncharacterized protein (TIGR04222 family)
LEAGGLLPDESTKSHRRRIILLASMALAGVGVIKIAIGLSRDRPILFLSILTIVAVIVLALAAAPFSRLTARGRQALDDIQAIYGGLKDRASDIHRGSATTEMLMLVAVFGAMALPPAEYAFAQTIFPQAASWFGGGGGSCGGGGCGGGGCGGGGCGGCGGCGG